MSKTLFKIAKTPIGDLIVGITFGTPLNKLLPVKRVKETDKELAFWHPKPFWEKHILLVPKKAIKDITSLTEADYPYIEEIYRLTKEIVTDLGWDETEYTVLTNGGDESLLSPRGKKRPRSSGRGVFIYLRKIDLSQVLVKCILSNSDISNIATTINSKFNAIVYD